MVTIESIDQLRRCLAVTETIAVVCSRLGHNLALHRHVCRFLTRSLMECRQRGASLIIAPQTAIEPWAARGAELFGVPSIRIAVGKDAPHVDYFLNSHRAASRDSVLIELADRVDAVYVRRSGQIQRCLQDRVGLRGDASTRVAVVPELPCAAAELISIGAIGWCDITAAPTPVAPNRDTVESTPDLWTRTEGPWLVHCTRSPRTHWPGETERQFRDSVLIGDSETTRRQPIDALCRIIRSGRLVAAATASDHQYSVVCFSQVALASLLQRRRYRSHLRRWDYEPYGIAIRRQVAESIGIQPVIYGDPKMRQTIAPPDRFRFHPVGKTYDWRVEQEWRSQATVDLNQLNDSDVRVFAADTAEARNRLARCQWQVSFIPQPTGSCL